MSRPRLSLKKDSYVSYRPSDGSAHPVVVLNPPEEGLVSVFFPTGDTKLVPVSDIFFHKENPSECLFCCSLADAGASFLLCCARCKLLLPGLSGSTPESFNLKNWVKWRYHGKNYFGVISGFLDDVPVVTFHDADVRCVPAANLSLLSLEDPPETDVPPAKPECRTPVKKPHAKKCAAQPPEESTMPKNGHASPKSSAPLEEPKSILPNPISNLEKVPALVESLRSAASTATQVTLESSVISQIADALSLILGAVKHNSTVAIPQKASKDHLNNVDLKAEKANSRAKELDFRLTQIDKNLAKCNDLALVISDEVLELKNPEKPIKHISWSRVVSPHPPDAPQTISSNSKPFTADIVVHGVFTEVPKDQVATKIFDYTNLPVTAHDGKTIKTLKNGKTCRSIFISIDNASSVHDVSRILSSSKSWAPRGWFVEKSVPKSFRDQTRSSMHRAIRGAPHVLNRNNLDTIGNHLKATIPPLDEPSTGSKNC